MIGMACCTLIAQAGEPGTGEKNAVEGSIQGYVHDAVTGKPVNGVTVSLQGVKSQLEQAMLSDASGYFKFGKLPAGLVTLLFEKKGYKAYRSEVQAVKAGSLKMTIDFRPLDDEGFESWHPLRKFMDLE